MEVKKGGRAKWRQHKPDNRAFMAMDQNTDKQCGSQLFEGVSD